MGGEDGRARSWGEGGRRVLLNGKGGGKGGFNSGMMKGREGGGGEQVVVVRVKCLDTEREWERKRKRERLRLWSGVSCVVVSSKSKQSVVGAECLCCTEGDSYNKLSS